MTAHGGGGQIGSDRGGWVTDLKARVRILEVAERYTKLRQAGGTYRGPCPLHGGTKPNFAVSPERGSFKCFVCDESGDAFTLVQKMEDLDFLAAAKLMAGWYGVDVTERRPPRTVSGGERTRQSLQTARVMAIDDAGGWEALGLATQRATRGLGVEVDGTGPLLTVPVGGTADTPLGWRCYRLEHLSDDRVVPVADGLDPASDPAAKDGLFVSERIRGGRVRDDVVLVDEPVTALRLMAAGYRAVVAPAAGLPAAEDQAWLSPSQAATLQALGVRRLSALISVGGPTSALRQRGLHATELVCLAAGIEWCVILPLASEWDDDGTPLHQTSWSYLDALGGTADRLRDILRSNVRVVDVFQRRVSQLAARLHATPPGVTFEAARQKVLPSLRAAQASGDAVLYHAYVAWAARALRARDRGAIAQAVHAPARVADAEQF